MRGETIAGGSGVSSVHDFNPLPSCEGRRFCRFASLQTPRFQSTPLVRGETWLELKIHPYKCISIHSPHARGDASSANVSRILSISIHSPHARGDAPYPPRSAGNAISIHSPHARGDNDDVSALIALRHFNPLPSCEGRPDGHNGKKHKYPFQSTPLMRGETTATGLLHIDSEISIHSPHARGDPCSFLLHLRPQSISIHSPHARGDMSAYIKIRCGS